MSKTSKKLIFVDSTSSYFFRFAKKKEESAPAPAPKVVIGIEISNGRANIDTKVKEDKVMVVKNNQVCLGYLYYRLITSYAKRLFIGLKNCANV